MSSWISGRVKVVCGGEAQVANDAAGTAQEFVRIRQVRTLKKAERDAAFAHGDRKHRVGRALVRRKACDEEVVVVVDHDVGPGQLRAQGGHCVAPDGGDRRIELGQKRGEATFIRRWHRLATIRIPVRGILERAEATNVRSKPADS